MVDNFFYKAISYFWYIFLVNFSFLLGNILLVVSFSILKFTIITMPFYLVGLMMIYPNFVALVGITRKIHLKKEQTYIFKNYFSLLKENLKNSLKLSWLYMGLVGLCLLNLQIIGIYGWNGLSPIFILLLVMILIHGVWAAIININFIVDIKGSIRISLFSMARYPTKTLSIFLILIMIWLGLYLAPQYTFIFGFGLLSLLVSIVTKKNVQFILRYLNGEDIEKESFLRKQLM